MTFSLASYPYPGKIESSNNDRDNKDILTKTIVV